MGTLLDLASLVMIPSGVKEDKLYSVKPTDGSGDFTFSRNSDIQATRVNSSGLIEKAKVNLLTYSNTFSNAAWSKANSTITSGQSGYDGSSDAWLLTDDTTNGSHDVRQSSLTFTGLNSLSVYAKAGTLNFLKVFTGISTTYFNLGTGEVGTNGHAGASIEAIGATGWYRCSLFDSGSFTFALIGATNADNVSTYAGTGSGTIYIQDAQLNYGLIAQDYVETTTTAVVEGLTADLPRLDYSGGASCPSLLLEPSRTNSIDQSEYAGAWTLNGVTIDSNDIISPEGVQNGTEVFASGSVGNRLEKTGFSLSGDYTFSVFLKKGTSTKSLFYDGVKGVQIDWDGSGVPSVTGFSGGAPAAFDYDDYGSGWYRVWFRDNYSGTRSFQVFPDRNGGSDSVYFYGAQLEAGSYPTSYIPTYGASAQRNDDSCEKTGISSLIGQTEGTAYIEFDPKNGTGERRFFLQIGSGSTTIYARIESGGTLTAQILNGGTDYLTSTGTAISSGVNKFAVAYANNDAVFYLNGTALATSSSVVVPALSALYVGSNSSGSQQLGADVNQSLLFKTRLSNTELAALTTI